MTTDPELANLAPGRHHIGASVYLSCDKWGPKEFSMFHRRTRYDIGPARGPGALKLDDVRQWRQTEGARIIRQADGAHLANIARLVDAVRRGDDPRRLPPGRYDFGNGLWLASGADGFVWQFIASSVGVIYIGSADRRRPDHLTLQAAEQKVEAEWKKLCDQVEILALPRCDAFKAVWMAMSSAERDHCRSWVAFGHLLENNATPP